ncbi:MAG: hypothetical protein U0230_03725 [Polyangiales bacterium]
MHEGSRVLLDTNASVPHDLETALSSNDEPSACSSMASRASRALWGRRRVEAKAHVDACSASNARERRDRIAELAPECKLYLKDLATPDGPNG